MISAALLQLLRGFCNLQLHLFFGGELLSRALLYWRIDAKRPCLLPSSKPCGPRSSRTALSQVVLGQTTGLGLLHSAGGLSVAAMTWWWFSLAAIWVRCPKNLSWG